MAESSTKISKPAGHVSVVPSTLTFDLNAEEPVSTLTIRNKLDTKVAFKIKTTEPKRYLVRPNQDVLDGLAECTVKVILQRRERSNLVKEHSSGNVSPDKFLVQSTEIDDELYETIRKGDIKSQALTMQKMWRSKGRKDTQNTRLQCKFEFPDAKTPAKDSSKISFETPKASGDNRPDPASIVDPASIAELRQKYHELVQFTVQLTAERDRFKTMAKDAKKELKMFRENVGATRTGAVDNLGKSLEANTGESPTAPAPASPGFSLWHILLAAVMSFLFARLMTSQA